MNIRAWFQSVVGAFISWIVRLFPFLRAPRIVAFSPEAGWPGSILTIDGAGFSDGRDANQVEVGGVAALVVDAQPTRLRVLVGAGTPSGPVRVAVAGRSAAAPRPFTVADWPDQRKRGEERRVTS